MDRIIAMALAVLFDELKDKKRAQRLRSQLFKLHGIIENVFPELQPESRSKDAKVK